MRKIRALAIAAALLAVLAGRVHGQAIYTGAAPVLEAGLTTTVKTVKGTAGSVVLLTCANTNASVTFVQVFDVASATSVTLGTTVPKLVVPVPASGVGMLSISNAIRFPNGIKAAATTTATGNTAPGTALDCTFGIY